MFGNARIKVAKSAPKSLPSNSRFAFIRIFMDRCYRDPYRWGLIKCVAFFAASVYTAQALCKFDILPADSPSTQATYQ